MKRLSTLVLSALAIAAVSGLTVLRTGLVAEAARPGRWDSWTPLVTTTYPVEGSFTDIAITDFYADVHLRHQRLGPGRRRGQPHRPGGQRHLDHHPPRAHRRRADLPP